MGNISSWVTQTLCPEEQLIWYACKNGDTHLLRRAVSSLSADKRHYLEYADGSGHTALAIACINGYRECIEILVAAGANCKTRDFEGNTVLHLAAKQGNSEIVSTLLDGPHPTSISAAGFQSISRPTQVDVVACNVSQATALDVARREFAAAEDGAAYSRCMELLEKKACLYSGWLYQRVDNLLSLASGISSLNSWKRRYCMVLATAARDVLEINLFAMKPGEKRPPCPSFAYLYRITDRVQSIVDTKWFNRKEYTFSLKVIEKRQWAHEVQDLGLAALSNSELIAWRTFLLNAQNAIDQLTNGVAVSEPLPPDSTRQEHNHTRMALHRSMHDTRHTDSPYQHASATSSFPSSAPPWQDCESMQPSFGPDGVEIAQQIETARSIPFVHSNADGAKSISTATNECVVCFDGVQSAVCVPCGHNAVCMDCATEIMNSTRLCPVCRVYVREIIKLYRV